MTTPAEITARVTASRAAQGLPPKVEDPAILAKVAALLRADVPTQSERRPTTGRLVADRINPNKTHPDSTSRKACHAKLTS